MIYLKLVRYYYIFLTVFVIISPVQASLLTMIPALILMWLTYFVFQLQFKKSPSLYSIGSVNINNDKYKYVILLVTLYSSLFVPLYIKFYTGQTIFSSIGNFINGDNIGVNSNYANYQKYFNEMQLRFLTLEKIPYILGAGILKFLFWVTVIRTIGFKRKLNKIDKASLFLLTIFYFLQGLSRGTSFELFEILLIVLFSLIIRNIQIYKKLDFTKYFKSTGIAILSISLFYFLYSVTQRHSGTLVASNATAELRFNENSFFFEISPLFFIILSNLNGYFMFGIFFTGVAITNIWSSPFGIISLILPLGLLGMGVNYSDLICDKIIDCGAAWIPDIIGFVQKFGLLITLFFISYMGKVGGFAYTNMINGSISSALMLFILLLFFISLPIGNFILTSSANQIATLLTILTYYFPNKFLLKKYLTV